MALDGVGLSPKTPFEEVLLLVRSNGVIWWFLRRRIATATLPANTVGSPWVNSLPVSVVTETKLSHRNNFFDKIITHLERS